MVKIRAILYGMLSVWLLASGLAAGQNDSLSPLPTLNDRVQRTSNPGVQANRYFLGKWNDLFSSPFRTTLQGGMYRGAFPAQVGLASLQNRVKAVRDESFEPGAFSAPVASEFPMFPLQQGEENRSAGRGKVFLKSLLIPGWGQYSLGAKGAARTFFIAELALWGTALAFHTYGNWLKDDYIDLAAAHAAVNPRHQKNQFWIDVGNFNSVVDYNEEKLRQRNVAALRDPAGPESWRWDTTENRRQFEDLRIRSDRAYERSSFTVAGVVVNHLISAIHALWVLRKSHHGASRSQQNYQFAWKRVPGSQSPGFSVRFQF